MIDGFRLSRRRSPIARVRSGGLLLAVALVGACNGESCVRPAPVGEEQAEPVRATASPTTEASPTFDVEYRKVFAMSGRTEVLFRASVDGLTRLPLETREAETLLPADSDRSRAALTAVGDVMRRPVACGTGTSGPVDRTVYQLDVVWGYELCRVTSMTDIICGDEQRASTAEIVSPVREWLRAEGWLTTVCEDAP